MSGNFLTSLGVPVDRHTTRNIFYKGQRENETSPSLSKIRCCHCCIYDVIASLLLNKAPKIETSVPYKGVPYKKYFVYSTRPLFYKTLFYCTRFPSWASMYREKQEDLHLQCGCQKGQLLQCINQKNKLLTILAIFNHHQPLPNTPNHLLLPMIIFLFSMALHIWPFLTITDHLRPLLTTQNMIIKVSHGRVVGCF